MRVEDSAVFPSNSGSDQPSQINQAATLLKYTFKHISSSSFTCKCYNNINVNILIYMYMSGRYTHIQIYISRHVRHSLIYIFIYVMSID